MAKYLLAVSGGPDSMFLLDKYAKRSPVVAHVNYHKRADSDHDEELVRAYCAKHNLKIYVKNVQTAPEKNFQAWARKVRYEFFQEIYSKEKCSALLTAHHKDDFLETGLMQLETERAPRLFGMAEKTTLFNMKVMRPFLHRYWKSEILRKLDKKQIAYAVDSTNAEPVYARNIMRQKIAGFSNKEKQSRYEWLVMCNRILRKKNRRIDATYGRWAKTDFALAFFRKQGRDQEALIFNFITNKFGELKISCDKLTSWVAFVNGFEGNKKYDLGKNCFLIKKDGKLLTANA